MLAREADSFEFPKLAAIRGKNSSVSPEKKEAVAECRKRIKKALEKIKAQFLFASEEEILSDLAGSRDSILMLLSLAEEFEQRFSAKKRERNLVDFNDLEHLALQVLYRDSGELSETADDLARQFDEILVDEYQDTNHVQYEIANLLAAKYQNLMVVGDDDQSIYGFRGARPEIMIAFKDYYPEAELIVLNVNYRSTQSIINVAGRVIENNKTRLDKCAHANNNKDFQPDIRKFRNQVEELKFVVSKIKEYENQGISLSEMAILVRNNSQIQELSLIHI